MKVYMKQRTRRKLLSILFTLAMALWLMPGNAFAEGHTHSFTYSADGATITATCNSAGCNLTENKVTLTIGDPTNIYWDDKSSSHEFTLVGLGAFNSATGKTISASDIVYYKGDNQSQDIKNNTVKGATYKARLTVEGVRAEHSFTFTAKPIVHTHNFTYAAEGNVITATCTQNASNMEACNLTNKQAILTLNAPLHTTYGDGKDANATLTGEIPGVTNPTIHYSKGSVTLSAAPTDAGTYTAWCQLGSATARVEYTINKATNPGWTTMPQAKHNLEYTGQPQTLITAGTASAGSALYTVGTDPDNEPDDTAGGRPYTSSVPEMTNAGTYYVWCKIDGGKNYTSINAQKVEVTIARADITITANDKSSQYGEPLAELDYTISGDYVESDNIGVLLSADIYEDSDVGEYEIITGWQADSNYNATLVNGKYTITKAPLTITAMGYDAVYDGEAHGITVDVGESDAVVYYGTEELTAENYETAGSTVNPEYTNAGEYTVYFYIVSKNYEADPVSGSKVVSIRKASPEISITNNDSQPYTGEALELIESGKTTGGTLVYAIGDENGPLEPYAESIPTAVDAGTYYVWYMAIGDENHNDSEPACVEVSIVDNRIDISEGTVTVDTENKTVTVKADGETVPESEYHVIYFTYEEIEGGETLTRVGTDFPTEPGTYIAGIVANEDSLLYIGENRSEPFTIEAPEESSEDESTPDSSTPDSSETDSSTVDSSEAESKADSSSNSGASNASTTNPATGAAAGMGAASLAAAALIVAKKKKDE